MGKPATPVTSGGDLAACIVRVFHRGMSSHDAAGTAILVDPGHVVTCAHVVEAVLGNEDSEHLNESQAMGIELSLELGVITGHRRRSTGKVIAWYAVSDDDAGADPRDIAVLKLDEPVDFSLRKALWSEYQPNDVGSFYGFGQPDLWVECECMGLTTNMVQLNCRHHEALPGYSGGPVFDRERQTLIGMLVASNAHKQVAKMIESRVLVQVLTRSGIAAAITSSDAPLRSELVPTALERRHLEQHLSLTFNTRASSEELLDLVGYPRARTPMFTRPIEFWRTVLQDIEFGLIEDGVPRLLAAAATVFPHHPVFGERCAQTQGGVRGRS